MKPKFKVNDKVKVTGKDAKSFTGIITEVLKQERPNFFGRKPMKYNEYVVEADDDGILYACSESRITKL